MTESSENIPNIFDDFEREFKVKIPIHLKKLLIFAGFDNNLTLEDLNDDDLGQIEETARAVVPNVFRNDELFQYLDKFASCPGSFCLLPGQKKLLFKLGLFAKNRMIVPNEQGKARKIAPNKEKSKSQRPVAAQNESTEEISIEERNDIIQKAIRWTREYICSTSKDDASKVLEKINEMKIIVMPGTTKYCQICCFICSSKCKIFRAATGTWLLSNYHKHLKTHSTDLSKLNRKRKSSYSILGYLNQSTEVSIATDSSAKKNRCDRSYDTVLSRR